jgi:hypothetical protein
MARAERLCLYYRRSYWLSVAFKAVVMLSFLSPRALRSIWDPVQSLVVSC